MLLDKLIYYALMNNDEILKVIAKTPEGIPLINRNRLPNAIYPAIEYHMIGGGDINYADDKVFYTRHTYQITFYGDEDNYNAVEAGMVEAMRDIGFKVTHKYSLVNPYTYITHYVYHVQARIEQTFYDHKLEIETKKYIERYGTEDIYDIPNGDYFDEDKEVNYVVVDGDEFYDEADFK